MSFKTEVFTAMGKAGEETLNNLLDLELTFSAQFLTNNLVVRKTTRSQFLFVLTHFSVAEDVQILLP